eukprot:TRINITY_DN1623_c0_g1_i1.p1 TRINITY_DN1623_c0_g1~~TRINITY_DN1623_c0_g1_i1.p1  ORF type:complete len:137 (-),score=20.33 TRINITY_DN1623_c0_g1_i1:14-424(-)
MSAKEDCIFCKIVAGKIPSYKVDETDNCLAFMDAFPISPGHTLIIPKKHYEKLHEVPEEIMSEIGGKLVKIAKAVGAADYNILQNNGAAAHQAVPHVHFHIIPKPDAEQGLGVKWPSKKGDGETLKKLAADISGRL